VVEAILHRIDGGSPLKGPTLDKARAAYRSSVVHARSLADWRRHEAWVSRYLGFAHSVVQESGLRVLSERALLAHNGLIRYYVATVAAENKGPTRPGKARRALSLARGRMSAPSLNIDASISDVVKSATKAAPTTPNQAQALSSSDVGAIVAFLEAKGDWYSSQIATMVAIGFYRLLRLGELRGVHAAGLRYVLFNGTEIPAGGYEPCLSRVRAILLHVRWRKQHVAMHTWVPVSGRRSLAMLLRQRARVRSAGTTFLFPSRRCCSSGDTMNKRNPLGAAQFITQLRAAIKATICAGLRVPNSVILAFRGHSLRVGGLNELRRRGVDGETRRLLGGWASVTSQARYEQLAVSERLALSENMARVPRQAGFSAVGLGISALPHLGNFAY
jgi:hypothetical protein